ncbi:hypothetical protein [Methyloceanibacter sp.]|uniref:hypothetical protein n=1 Tax=Methyloceanibacter sp. TaxID=1965321 RepID=UPI003D9B8874
MAEFSHTRIAYAFAACLTDREPNLIACGRAIYSLQHKVKTEGQFQFADHDDRRLVSP